MKPFITIIKDDPMEDEINEYDSEEAARSDLSQQLRDPLRSTATGFIFALVARAAPETVVKFDGGIDR